MCAQNAKLTQKYVIWIKIPNDEYLNTSKGAFYEDEGQKLNWFGLKCLNQMYNKVPKTSSFQATENVKSLLWLQGTHNTKHFFLANSFLFDLHIKKAAIKLCAAH